MLMGALIPAGAQAQALSLDSCRAMALRNNKQINASKLKKHARNTCLRWTPWVDMNGSAKRFPC